MTNRIKNRVVFLASGGLDSSVGMAMILNQGYTIYPLYSYGNDLKPEGMLRLIDALVHLVMFNDKEMEGPGAYDLPKDRRFKVYGDSQRKGGRNEKGSR